MDLYLADTDAKKSFYKMKHFDVCFLKKTNILLYVHADNFITAACVGKESHY